MCAHGADADLDHTHTDIVCYATTIARLVAAACCADRRGSRVCSGVRVRIVGHGVAAQSYNQSRLHFHLPLELHSFGRSLSFSLHLYNPPIDQNMSFLMPLLLCKAILQTFLTSYVLGLQPVLESSCKQFEVCYA
jgi:hypothetical protein